MQHPLNSETLLKPPKFLSPAPFPNPGCAEGDIRRALLIFFSPNQELFSTSTRCSHPHGQRLQWRAPSRKCYILTVCTFTFSRRNPHRILSLRARHPFSPDHTSILAHTGKEKSLHPLPCTSWWRGSSTFPGHTLFCSDLHWTSPSWEHPESHVGNEISGAEKAGANKVLGMEFGWIVWEGLGLKVENTSGSTFSFSSAWGHLALWCDNCRGNYSKSLTVCRNTVRETTQSITTTEPLQTGF